MIAVISSVVLSLFIACVHSGPDALFDPCHKDDIKCLSEATEVFLSKTYGGVPQLGIQPIDPLVIPSEEVVVDKDLGLAFHFRNTQVTGLKNLKIADFKMDTKQRSVLLKMSADVSVTADMDVKLTKAQKTFSGPYTATATVHGTSEYGYSLKEINGTEYFEVGKETSTCEITEDPVVTIGTELQNVIDTDADAKSLKAEWESKKQALRKKALCKIVGRGFETVMQNLRTSATLFPKTAFFYDI